jgi:cellulose synthase/poly-beta-1,6-N-acetylglucosamine synthase-like glycosyltransferase
MWMDTPISVIIPAWNEEKALQGTVEGLIDMDYDKRLCEIVVVAGGGDQTYDIATALSKSMDAFAGYVVIRQKPDGKNTAIQQGLKAAHNEIVVLLDADTIVEKGSIAQLAESVKSGRCDLAIANPIPIHSTWVSEYYEILKKNYLQQITTYPGNAMAFQKTKVNNRFDYFFDKDTKVGVDYLLAKRFQLEGYRVKFIKEAVVKTHLPSSLKYFILTENRWLTAFLEIEGVQWRAMMANYGILASVVFAIPFSKWLFTCAALTNMLFVWKKIRVFLGVYGRDRTKLRQLIGFVFLSYVHHLIGCFAHAKKLAGWPKSHQLCQGQRF